MKKYFLLAFALVLTFALLLCGCDQTKPAPETMPTEQQPSTVLTEPPVTYPVEEDVFYFPNELEYNRLYSQRLDGSDLTLVLDESCYSVTQQGDTVYFLDGRTLTGYHIPTAQCNVVAENVITYAISEDILVYSVSTGEYFTYDLRYRNLASGEDVFITKLEMMEFVLNEGYVYFTGYDASYGNILLSAYNLENGQITALSGDYWSYSYMMPVTGGICFQAYSENGDGWYFASGDGSVFEKLDIAVPNSSRVFHMSDSETLYIHWNYIGDGTTSIRRLTPDGQDKTIAEVGEDVYFSVTPLGNERWLVEESDYVNWGEMDEYGYYSNYCAQIKYMLMDAEGTVTPLPMVTDVSNMFAEGDFPVIDSSTARKPVTAALYNLFVKGYDHKGAEPVCSTTHGAWLNIADGKVDLALLAAPTEEEQAYLQSKGVEVEMKLYGGDGLVFIGNAANPVTNLTHEQILAIYRGEITNWSEVGGPDHPISVYYRDDQSGSQRLFESLVFKGEEIPDFASMDFYIMDEMSTLVNIVLYDPYAIGYSIMTYLDEVYAEEELQVFAVNGVTPSAETVKDQSYPYNTKGYLVIRSDEPEGSPARRLFDWFGCPLSDDLLTQCSVSPLSDED